MKEIIEKLEEEKERLEEEKNKLLEDIEYVDLKIKKMGHAIDILEDSESPKKVYEKSKPITRKSYPKEMYNFIKENMEELGNIELCKKIESELGFGIIPTQLASYMYYNKLKRKDRLYGIRMKTKKSVIIDNSRKTKTKYPKEMEEFVKDNLGLNNVELVKKVNEKFGLNLDAHKMSGYLIHRNIRRDQIDKKAEKKTESKYTDVKHFSDDGKYLCNPSYSNKEKLTENWDEVNCGNCQRIKNRKVKKDKKPKPNFPSIQDVSEEIQDYVKKNLNKDYIYLRDGIIEKFEVNYNSSQIKSMINKFKSMKGESTEEEVKRIEEKIGEEYIGDDSIDGMDLD